MSYICHMTCAPAARVCFVARSVRTNRALALAVHACALSDEFNYGTDLFQGSTFIFGAHNFRSVLAFRQRCSNFARLAQLRSERPLRDPSNFAADLTRRVIEVVTSRVLYVTIRAHDYIDRRPRFFRRPRFQRPPRSIQLLQLGRPCIISTSRRRRWKT